MKKFTRMDKIRYHFDNYMSRGTTALIAGLFCISLFIVLIGAAIVAISISAQKG